MEGVKQGLLFLRLFVRLLQLLQINHYFFCIILSILLFEDMTIFNEIYNCLDAVLCFLYGLG